MTNDRVVIHEARTADNGKTWKTQQTLFSSDGGTTWKPLATGGIVNWPAPSTFPVFAPRWDPIPSGRLASSPHPTNPPRSYVEEGTRFHLDAARYFRGKYPNPPVLWGHTHDTKPIGRIFNDTHDTVEVLRSVDDFLREAGADKRKRAKAMGNPDPYAAAAEALGCTREEAKKRMFSWPYGWTTPAVADTLPDPHED